MQVSARELSSKTWNDGAVPWTLESTRETGLVVSSSLPNDPELANLAIRIWKSELRLWWSAWTTGHQVMELRSWWKSSRQFHIWCVSNSSQLKPIDTEDARKSNECQLIISQLHAQGLAHGALSKIGFFRTEEGPVLALQLDLDTISGSFSQRRFADERFFNSFDRKEDVLPPILEDERHLLATFSAEQLQFYKLLYPFQVEKRQVEGFPKPNLVIRLLKDEPHPEYGSLQRPPASSFYQELFKQSEGEEASLILNDNPDLFSSGTVANILGEYPEDENCLVVSLQELDGFKLRNGWCRAKDDGTANLAGRKRDILKKALNRRHIHRWVKPRRNERADVDRQFLVDKILQNEGIYCIQGPPGTGKTHLACDVVGSLLAEDPEARILVCAKEHQALNTLRSKLLSRYGDRLGVHVIVSKPTRKSMGSSIEGTSFDWAKRLIAPSSTDKELDFWAASKQEWRGQPPPSVEQLYEESAQVVFATTTSWPLNQSRFNGRAEPFDLVVVEEAGKCYPSELLAPLAISRCALLIGDQKQLPPFQLEQTKDAVDYLEEISPKIIARTAEAEPGKTPETDWTEVKRWLQPFAALYNMGPSFMLREEYRMVGPISDLISEIFYSSSLVNKRNTSDSKPLFSHPALGDMVLVWIDTPHSSDFLEAREDLTGHRFNKMELDVIAQLLARIHYHGNDRPDIAILSPYNAQVDRLSGNKGLSSALLDSYAGIPQIDARKAVRTVDSFQGDEADLVIVSLVRNNSFANPRGSWGFVLNEERLNVMLSRARRHLIVVGSAKMVEQYSDYPETEALVKVLKYIRAKGQVISASKVLNS